MTAPPTPPKPLRNTSAAIICAALLVVFYVVSSLAVLTKCATIDEPLHAMGALIRVYYNDYRLNAEDPPLWNYWVMLPHSRDSLPRVDLSDPMWLNMVETPGFSASFVTRTLFQTHGNDGAAFINRSRAVMLLIGVMLGALIATSAWKLAGPAAAVVATTLYCFDPNFIAHAPLVKNDVAISFLMLATAATIWSVGRRVTWWNVLLLGLVVGAAMSVKFSGVLFGPIVLIALLIRAFLSTSWPMFSTHARGLGPKLLIVMCLCVTTLLISWGVIWASYRFRFEPTSTPGVLLPLDVEVRAAARNLLFLQNAHHYPTPQQIDQWRPTLLVRGVVFAQEHHLLPQAYLYGFLMTYEATLVRTTYLLGQHSVTGWWYYFPLAMLFKTPVATLAAFFIAIPIAVIGRKRLDPGSRLDRWTLACLLVPIVIYGASALSSNLNLGIRHVLPIYPFLYLFVAIAAVPALAWYPRVARPMVVMLAAALLVETLASFPDYIAFFNAPSKPWRVHLLSDSNLDWGQDLPALAAWQKEHRGERLYLAYFGSVDPRFYDIDYVNMPGGFWLGPAPRWPDPAQPCVVAVSATRLQGNNMPETLGDAYQLLRQQKPREVLGGSIYLFDFPPRRP